MGSVIWYTEIAPIAKGVVSGFPLILDAWLEKHWPRPELVEEQDLMQVKLVLYINSETENVQKNVQKELTVRQSDILQLIWNEPKISLEEMSKRLNVSLKTVHRDIKAIQDKGIVMRKGGCADGHWVIQNIE